MIVGHERRRLVLGPVGHPEGVDVAEDDDGDGGEVEALLPDLVAACKDAD